MQQRIPQIKRILGYLRQYRYPILWAFLALVVTDVLALVPPWLVKDAIDSLPSFASSDRLLPYLGAIVLVVSGQAVFRFIWRRSLFGISRRAEYLLRNDLFRHLQRQDRKFYLRHRVGDLMSRCTNDLQAVQELIAYFGLLVVDSLLTIGPCLVLMGIIDPLLTLAALIPLPFLSVAFFYFGRRVRQKSREVQDELAKLTQVVQETVAGIRMIQAYTLEKVRRTIYREATERYIRRNLELANMRGVFYASLMFMAGFAAVIVLWFGGVRVIRGHLSLGGFVAFGSYLMMLIWPMMSFGFMVNLLQRGRGSLERLDEILQEEPEITDPSLPIPSPNPRGGIRFRGVSFRYPSANRWALRRISLEIEEGSKTGITGPVGSGKTTLLELIPRIYDPVDGVITLDGQDIRSVPLADLRQRVRLVAQEPFVFSDSLSANIRFGSPEADPETVDRVARLVRLDKDLDAFPHGWETRVGERGMTVSGGQRQRLALARAILVAPRVLVLDDAFAHLDEETESEVIRNLLEALPRTTVIFTSHRTASLRLADRLAVLADGRILEEGPPDRLVQTGGYFQRICDQHAVAREMAEMGEEIGE